MVAIASSEKGQAKPPSAHVDDSKAENVPDEMRSHDAWVVWAWRYRGGKWTKTPIDPFTGDAIDATKPAAWMSFDKARELARLHGDGIGFALGNVGRAKSHDLVAIDSDDCIDEAGEIDAGAMELVARFNSYTEKTPSGRGLRIWIRGTKPSTDCRKPTHENRTLAKVEIYSRDRFLTVTGQVPEGFPAEIADRQQELDELHRVMFGQPELRGKPQANGRIVVLSDEELIEKARNARNGAKFADLYDRGDITAYGGDDSAADLALANLLAYWTKDSAQIGRLMLASALRRDERKKWQERNEDYLMPTIEKAIRDCPMVFSAQRNSIPNREHAPTSEVKPLVNSKGKLISCLHNSIIWLEDQARSLSICHDVFSQTIMVDQEPLSDRLLIALTARIEADRLTPWDQSDVKSAIIDIAHRHEFNSLTRWLDSLIWDGIRRLDAFFHRGLGCEESDYSTACSRELLLSAVARAYKPGCQADTMVVLIGQQGIGKSMAIATLCPNPDWFTDDLPDLHEKKAAENLRGKWLVEFSEFMRINRAKNDAAKAFLTRKVDRFRLPYAHFAEDFPRSCIFIGTTNDVQPLRDVENRRYMPIECTKSDLDWIRDNRDQLWAEAVARYKAGEEWWVSDPMLLEKVRDHQANARQEDALEDLLQAALIDKDQVNWDDIFEALQIKPGEAERSLQTRIGIAMSKVGFKKECKGSGKNRSPIWTKTEG